MDATFSSSMIATRIAIPSRSVASAMTALNPSVASPRPWWRDASRQPTSGSGPHSFSGGKTPAAPTNSPSGPSDGSAASRIQVG